MKKSTLITTIAMIVVVVVALSTATYAWFSSATTTSTSDTITTEAQANWVIMGGKATAGVSENAGKDVISYSSSNAIELTMLDGLYSPEEVLNGTLNNASNSALFTPQKFYTALQDGTGLSTTAKVATLPSIDPLPDNDTIPSAANYVRIISTASDPQNLVLTITVVSNGESDADYYAANAFSTYVTWYAATGATGSANTMYYYGDVDEAGGTTGQDAGYYIATLTDANMENDSPTKIYDPKAKSVNAVYQQTIDEHNIGARAGTSADPSTGYVAISNDSPLTIGQTTLTTGKYYQIKIAIASNLAQNSAVNVAFYAWFDGWALDNTGANSGATVFYEFGDH